MYVCNLSMYVCICSYVRTFVCMCACILYICVLRMYMYIICIHSLRSLSYNRSTASSKASSPQSEISCFLSSFQYTLVSFMSSSSCFRLLPRRPVIYILFSTFPSITCSRWQFIREMWLIQFAFRSNWKCCSAHTQLKLKKMNMGDCYHAFDCLIRYIWLVGCLVLWLVFCVVGLVN